MAVQGRRDRDQLGMTVVDDTAEQKAVWHIRESGVGASRIPGVEDAWPSWEDAAVPPERLGEYLREITRLLDEYGYAYTTYGHFGDGCVHMRITFDVRTPQGVRRFRTFMERAADIVLSHGGSLSGEHGDGQARAELLPKMFGPELIEAFREYKAIWDPAGKMNPGKLVDPYPLDSNLRTGPEYHRRPVMTHFRFPEDHGSMAEATERCFGVGKCRHLEGGTMCPSFMVTRDEMHTTRGRARLLFEMLRGEAITDGWKSEPVKEALDLCFACKGCKGDCPVSVDIATYKAEFLSHYYEGRLRPAAAYAMGLIFQWARLAARAPALVNFVTQTPFLAGLAKRAAGLAPERDLPPFARETFQAWWVRRRWNQHGGPVAAPGGAVSTVVLWPDTFTNYFHPEIGRAAVDVLERAGHRVVVPPQPLCCGRPLYDYGMLDRAKVQLRQILETLRPYIRAGVPFVGLEPSCVAVFRDELGNLFPDDEDARRLSRQTFWLSEFLTNGGDADLKRLPKMSGRAVLHVHCHQKALHHGAQGGDAALLRALGLEVDVLDSGCCGVAGSFGYERDHYEVSIKAGERVLLPAVRGAAPDTLIVADGFSCRNQIEHATRRRALHLAEVVQLAYEEEARGGKRLPVFAEQRFPNEPAALPLRQLAAAAAAVGLGAIALRAAADACRRRSASPASSTRAADAKRAEGGHVALRR
jgi:Fe-S oxidoreductase